MAIDLQSILEGIALVSVSGFIGSMLIHVLDTITQPGYKTKPQRKKEAALLKREARKKHGKSKTH